MTNGKDIRAGGGYVEITTRDKGFTEGLRQSLRQASQWAKKMAAVGGGVGVAAGAGLFGIGSALEAVKGLISGVSIQGFAQQFSEVGDALQKMSDRTGIAVSDLSALEYAASLNDFTMDDLQKAVVKIGDNLTQAAGGSKTAKAAFDRLGLSVDKFAGQNQLQRFESVIDALSRIEDPAQRAAAAIDVMGKGGVAFLPLVTAGAGALEDARKEAEALGIVLSDDNGKAAAELNDNFGRLSSVIKGLGTNLGAAFADNFNALLRTGTQIVGTINHIVRRNEKLIGSLVPIAAGAFAVATAFAAVAGSVAFIGPMIPAIALVGAKLTALSAAAVFLGSNWRAMADVGRAAFQYVANVSQWALNNMGDNFREFFRWGLNGFQTFANGAKSWIGAIANAIAAGDIAAAFDVVQETMKTGWTITTQTLLAGWKATTLNMELLGLESFYAIMEGWELLKNAMAVGFSYIKREWIDVTQKMKFVGFETFYALLEGNELLKKAFREAEMGVYEGLQNMLGHVWYALKSNGFDEAAKFLGMMEDANKAALEESTAKNQDNINALESIRRQRDEARMGNRAEKAAMDAANVPNVDNAALDAIRQQRDEARRANAEQFENVGRGPMDEINAAMDRLAKAQERAANAQGVDLKNKGLNLGGFDASAFEAKELNTGRTSAAMGTFSAAAAGQLGAGSYDQEQVNLLGMIHDQLRFIALRGGIQ